MNWNALTDGHTKYVYFFEGGDEWLFDLDNDPYEVTNLASIQTDDSEELLMWRARMVSQFEEEERGSVWVLNGNLQTMEASYCSKTKFGPNYPCYNSSNPTQQCDIS
mmetsp:Transcript_92520/g.264329  ORF Transcript_92520/g.264329 Transcript_92520/m.264329 type:complete len:107 (+) Transcript_92520:75-395(+)